MAARRALITGIAGQDGSLLAELLLSEGYEVFGVVRRATSEQFENLDGVRDRVELVQADLLDELLRSAPVREVSREVVRLQPNWNQAYNRHFPRLVPLGPFFGLLGREVAGPGGDVARIVLERAA